MSLENVLIPKRNQHIPFKEIALQLKKQNKNKLRYTHVYVNEQIKENLIREGKCPNKSTRYYHVKPISFTDSPSINMLVMIMIFFLNDICSKKGFFEMQMIFMPLFFVIFLFIIKDMIKMKLVFQSLKDTKMTNITLLFILSFFIQLALSFNGFLWSSIAIYLCLCAYSIYFGLDKKYEDAIILKEQKDHDYRNVLNDRNIFDAYFVHHLVERKDFEPYFYELIGELSNSPSSRFDFSFLSEQERSELLFALDKMERVHANHLKYEINESCPFYICFLRFKTIQEQNKTNKNDSFLLNKWKTMELNKIIKEKEDELKDLVKVSSHHMTENKEISDFFNKIEYLKKETNLKIKIKELAKLNREIKKFKNNIESTLIEVRNQIS